MSYTIGQAAEASGISRKMIRYYEETGLLPAARRSDSGYRFYDDAAIKRLQFIRRARDLGFSLERINQLLGFWQDKQRHSADVKALAEQYIAEWTKHPPNQAMRNELLDWVQHCHGDDRPECALLTISACSRLNFNDPPDTHSFATAFTGVWLARSQQSSRCCCAHATSDDPDQPLP